MQQGPRFIHHAQIIFRREKNGAYLFDPDSGNLKYLNSVGALLYELCDGLHPVQEMIAKIASEYQGVPTEQVENDVNRFLADLMHMNYVTTTRTPGPLSQVVSIS
jgi:hypothetical protein